MSDTFRKAMLGRLPTLPPTRAPWADEPKITDGDDLEELEEGDTMSELGQTCLPTFLHLSPA
jgi:protein phosphatase methylesterase 1